MTRARLPWLYLGVMVWLVGCGGDDGPAVDQCVNASDQAVITSIEMMDGGVPMDGGPAVASSVESIVEGCVRTPDCISALLMGGDVEGCVDTCLDTTAAGDLSQGCQDCFIDVTSCVTASCAQVCFSGTMPDECDACVNTNCIPPKDACTGL